MLKHSSYLKRSKLDTRTLHAKPSARETVESKAENWKGRIFPPFLQLRHIIYIHTHIYVCVCVYVNIHTQGLNRKTSLAKMFCNSKHLE